MDEEKPWSLQHYVGEWIGRKNLSENSSLGTDKESSMFRSWIRYFYIFLL